MTSTQRNILSILANANNDFKGTLAICVQNANMLFSELFEVSATDLQNLGFGQLQSEAFLKSLTIIMRWEGVHRQTNVTKSHIAHIVSLLKDANQKLAAIENAEYDAKVAEIAALPKVAEMVAKATQVRNLIAELQTCNGARFFEIANAIDEIGYSYETDFSIANLKEQILSTFGSFENYEFFSNCHKFYTGRLPQDSVSALRAAATRLGILYIYDEENAIITEPCDEVKGMRALYVLDEIIGWLQVIAPNNSSPAQLIQEQADATELPLNEYMDLHPEAGFKFETPDFIGKDFDTLDLLYYTHYYKIASKIELDFSQPNNKRFAFVESFYQYCMWHAYQRYTKNFKPVVDLFATQTLKNSKKPVIFGGELKSHLFNLDLKTMWPSFISELNLEFDIENQNCKIALNEEHIDCSDSSLNFDFCDNWNEFSETCNKRWNAQGNTHTGNLYSDYPIFSFFETVLLNL